jgi:transcriptional regulator GlxA family with amidase domain
MRSRPSFAFLLLKNFTLAPFACFVDMLRLAADEGDLSRPIRCDWSVVSAGSEPIRSSCGIEVSPLRGLDDPSQYDYIVVIGGLLHQGPQIDEASLAFIRAAVQAGVTIIGLCTGSFAMAQAGIMKGHRCCVHWYHHRDMNETFPDVKAVSNRLFVVDGKRITCAGGTATLALAAWVLSRHLGTGVVRKALDYMCCSDVDPGGYPEPQPQPPAARRVRNRAVQQAMLIIEENIAGRVAVDELARRVNLSTRQLERLFSAELGVSPHEYILDLKLGRARWLLKRTSRNITDIALECGFADTSHFGRHFRKVYGQTPSAYRGGDETDADDFESFGSFGPAVRVDSYELRRADLLPG